MSIIETAAKANFKRFWIAEVPHNHDGWISHVLSEAEFLRALLKKARHEGLLRPLGAISGVRYSETYALTKLDAARGHYNNMYAYVSRAGRITFRIPPIRIEHADRPE